MIKLPQYRIIQTRPVKVVQTTTGKMVAYAYNWETGGFDLAMEYLIMAFPAHEIKQVSKEEFEQYVQQFMSDKPRILKADNLHIALLSCRCHWGWLRETSSLLFCCL